MFISIVNVLPRFTGLATLTDTVVCVWVGVGVSVGVGVNLGVGVGVGIEVGADVALGVGELPPDPPDGVVVGALVLVGAGV
jgi:hypothetical protein